LKRGIRPGFDKTSTAIHECRALDETPAAKNGVIDDQEHYGTYYRHEQAVKIQPGPHPSSEGAESA